jgi:hypothetical protein
VDHARLAQLAARVLDAAFGDPSPTSIAIGNFREVHRGVLETMTI